MQNSLTTYSLKEKSQSFKTLDCLYLLKPTGAKLRLKSSQCSNITMIIFMQKHCSEINLLLLWINAPSKNNRPSDKNPNTRHEKSCFGLTVRVSQETLKHCSRLLLPLVSPPEVEGKSIQMKTITSDTGPSSPWVETDLKASSLRTISMTASKGGKQPTVLALPSYGIYEPHMAW